MFFKFYYNFILYKNLNNYYFIYKLNNKIFYNIFSFIEFNKFFLKLNKLNYLKNKIFFFKLFNIGLGFKNFIFNNKFYLYLGDANYLKFIINKKIKIICKKNQIIFFSKLKTLLFNFINKLINIKKINIYKGKGIIFYSNFKFMRLKKGKKKS
jgi:hypothetical protein